MYSVCTYVHTQLTLFCSSKYVCDNEYTFGVQFKVLVYSTYVCTGLYTNTSNMTGLNSENKFTAKCTVRVEVAQLQHCRKSDVWVHAGTYVIQYAR